MDRGTAFLLTIVIGATLASVEACNDVDDDLPPYSTNAGYQPPVSVGVTDAATDAASDADADADAALDAALDAEADAPTDAMGSDGILEVDIFDAGM